MPIINKGSVSKGSSALFTLDATALSQLPLVAGSDFALPSSWKAVIMFFKSNNSKQSESITFDMTKPAPQEANFKISNFAKGNFELISITIYDFDNGFISVPRSAITASEFDVIFPSIVWTKQPSLSDFGTQGGLQTNSLGGFTNGAISQAFNGDFDAVMVIEQTSVGTDFLAGFALSELDLSNNINSYNPAHIINGSYNSPQPGQNALEWGLGMEDNPSGNFGVGVGIYKVRFTRIGSTITYELTNTSDVVFSQGNAKTGYTGPVHFVFCPFNNYIRLNSITVA